MASHWSLSMVTGGIPLELPYSCITSSIFSQDGKYLICTLTYQLRIYFISTRQCIKTIDIDLTNLSDIKLDPMNENQIILFKNNGEFLMINFKDKLIDPIVSQKSLNIELPLLSVVSAKHMSFIVISGKFNKKKNHAHTRYIQIFDRDSETLTTIHEIHNVINYSQSSNNQKLAFVTSTNEVHLIDISKEEEISKEVLTFPYKSPIISIVISNNSIIALGCQSGTIQILYGGLETEKPQRLLKWHIDQVKSLSFSPDNLYLLSGGLEKVLVFWQLETGKKSFLPRLNGIIDKISIDDSKNEYISLLLRVDQVIDNFEILVISQVDLVSRLSVSSIRPKFSNNITTTINKTKKKYFKLIDTFDKQLMRYDYSCEFEIHPKSKNLYFPNQSTIQSFDLIKNEQNFIQHAAPILSTGKVRSETKLIDPNVTILSFSNDGDWMCTFDEILTSEVDNLLSKNDKQYALKFWKFNNNTWELTTKIIDPHGAGLPIKSIIAAPNSYFNGVAFLTCDSKTGLRIWRPSTPKEQYKTTTGNKNQQVAWSLRKNKQSGGLASDAISLAWSDDSSLIFISHEYNISILNSKTMTEVEGFKIPTFSESKIRSINLLGHDLIILSKTRISSFNLLTGQLNDLVAKVNTTSGGKNIIAIDPIKKLICLGVNYYNTDNEEFKINSKFFIFKPNSLKPVKIINHNTGISSIRYFNSSFIFIDLNCRVGTITSNDLELQENIEFNLSNEISSMLISAQATVDIMNNRQVKTNTNQKNGSIEDNDDNAISKIVDLHTFQPIFQNLDGVQIDTLFDRIVEALK
ncbi:unnamed protein product [Candida verbasci]|uniref:NET1-associated nuclear protein 1 n=1 Tax=Candida verbasci TaxID=1227364 RepID=A0A9W4XHT2_9ASCO|nr:unnamed protein product [Candida verbasci]